MKIKITHRWNGDKTGKILTINDHESLSKINRGAWLDFMPLMCRVHENFLRVKVTLDYKLVEIYDSWLKEWKSISNAEDYLIMQAVHEYIINHTMSYENVYELLIRTHERLEIFLKENRNE